MDPLDEFAQALARGMSRRQALRQLAGGVAAAVVATLVPWRVPTEVFALPAYTPAFAVTGVSVSGVPITTGGSTASSVQMGANGPKVEAIQYLLRQNAIDVVVDGDFGEQTDEAVHTFQASNSLTVDGVVGPETWGALFVNVQQGAQGDAVSAVQTLLNMRGKSVEVDGDFGEQTANAVKSFQRDKKITPANGIVERRTWTALVSD